ncbi:hypothetical protein [Roseateles chitinivorans]|uniref:hypothetical protein n=1 Tax=Roseateles chitinivorans TaxID=2917965 RepID=UPI003D66EBC2
MRPARRLRRGEPLGPALDAVLARFPAFEPGAALGRLLNQGAFTGVTEISP